MSDQIELPSFSVEKTNALIREVDTNGWYGSSFQAAAEQLAAAARLIPFIEQQLSSAAKLLSAIHGNIEDSGATRTVSVRTLTDLCELVDDALYAARTGKQPPGVDDPPESEPTSMGVKPQPVPPMTNFTTAQEVKLKFSEPGAVVPSDPIKANKRGKPKVAKAAHVIRLRCRAPYEKLVSGMSSTHYCSKDPGHEGSHGPSDSACEVD